MLGASTVRHCFHRRLHDPSWGGVNIHNELLGYVNLGHRKNES